MCQFVCRGRIRIFLFFFLFGVSGGSTSAFAAQEVPQSFTLDGKLYSDAVAGAPLLGTGTLKIQILDSTETCALYEESQSYDTTATNGTFNIQVGEATSPISKRTAGDSGHALADLFVNDGSLVTGKLVSNGAACTGSASAGSPRFVRITVTPTSGADRVLSPNLPLSSIPSAMVAESAQSLSGKTASQFVQVNTTAPASLSQSNLENVFSTANYPKLTDLLAGNSSSYVKAMTNNSIQIPSSGSTPSTPAAGQIWYEGGALKYWDGSSAQALGVSGAGLSSLIIGTGLTPTGTISTGGQTISVDVGISTGQIVQVQSGGKLPVLDGSNLTNLKDTSISGDLSVTSITTSGSAAIGSNVSATGYVSSAETRTSSLKIFNGANSLEFLAPTLSGSTSFTLPPARPGVSGYVLSSDTSGVMTWVAQTTAGLSAVSNTAALAQDKIWIGDSGGKAQEKSLSGDVTLVASGVATVTGILGVVVSAAPTTTGQVLRYNSTGTQLEPAFLSMFDLRSTVTGSAAFGGVGCLANQTLTWTAATDNLACSNITGVAAANITNTAAGNIASTTVQAAINELDTEKVAKNGDTMTGTLSLPANGLVVGTNQLVMSSGNIGIGTTTPGTSLDLASRTDAIAIPSGTTAQRPSSPVNGYTRYNTDLKGVEAYINGSWQQVGAGASPTASEDGKSLRWNNTTKQFDWFTAGVSGAGIGTLNGLTASTQNFAIGTGGLAPNFDSQISTHTLNIPMANTASVTAGLISKTEYDTFNSKLGTATSFSGDVSGSYNSTSVDKIKGKAVTTPTASGQMFVYNGGAIVPVVMSGDATMIADGTMTLKNTGSAGTYFKVTTDAQGRVTSGATGLGTTEIPDLPWSKITSGIPTNLAGYGINDAVQNAGNTPSIQSGLDASKPSSGWTAGRIYIASDAKKIYRDSGSAWVEMAPATASGVTSLTAGTGLSGGTISTTGTIALSTATQNGLWTGDGTDVWRASGKVGIGTATSTNPLTVNGRIETRKGLLFNQGSGAMDNLIYLDSMTSGRVDASLGFFAAGVGGDDATDGPYFLARGNDFSALANQRGNMYFVAGSPPTPGANEGSLIFSSGMDLERLRITAAGRVGIGTANPVTKLEVKGTLKISDGGETCSAAGDLGMIHMNGTNLQFCNGSSWQTLSTSSGGMTSFNGLNASSQTLGIGTAGTAPGWVSATSTHTLNIPMASSASVTAGLISKTDYDAFNSKLGTGTSLSGDVSGTYNNTSVDKIKGKAVTSVPTLDGQILRYNGTSFAPAFISMFDLRSTVTGSAAFGGVGCLSNQTLTWTAATDNLACANIALPVSQMTGVLPVSNGGTGTSSLAGAFVINGGQNGAVSAGTNDVTNLTLKTNGSARVTVTSAGNVGIGTAAPLGTLDVYASASAPSLRLSYNSTTSYAQIYESSVNQMKVYQYSAAGAPLIDFNPIAVDGTSSSYIRLFRDTATTGNSGLQIFHGDGTGTIDTQLSTRNSDSYLNANGGNVGIGTASPNAKLTLQGGMSFSQLASDPAGTASYGSVYAKNDGKLYYRNGTGTIKDLTAGGGSPGGSDTQIQFNNSSAFGGSSKLTWNNSSSIMTIAGGQTAGSLYFGDNTHTLDLSATGLTMQSANKIDVSASGQLHLYSNTGPLLIESSTGEINLTALNKVWVSTDGGTTKSLMVDASGNVGIGTATPNSKLTIDGGMTLKQQVSDLTGTANYGSLYTKTDGKLYYRNGTGTITNLTAGGGTPGGSDKQIQFNNSSAFGGSSKLTWNDSTGSLGIGTAGAGQIAFAGAGTLSFNGGPVQWGVDASSNMSLRSFSGTGTVQSLGNMTLWSDTGSITLHTDTGGDLLMSPKGDAKFQMQGGTVIVNAGGAVGIGTTSPGSGTKLSVEGQIRAKSFSISTAAVDWSAGNSGTTSYDCAGAISFANLRDGGSYTLVVTGTGTTQCSFNTTTTGDDAGTVSYRFNPANAVRTTSSHTVYSLMRVGNIVYVSWITGF